jgi:hypothetical protein
MNTQDIQDVIMSYTVDVSDSPKWFINAWRDSFFDNDVRRGTLLRWNSSYPDYVFSMGREEITVTFPDEQSYVWFVLRWS